MSLFPGCDALVQLSDDLIAAYTQKLTAYLNDYYALAYTFCTDVFLGGTNSYDEAFREDAEAVFSDPELYCEVVTKCNATRICYSVLKDFVARSRELILPRHFAELDADLPLSKHDSLSVAVSPQKAQQVLRFCAFLNEQYDLRNCSVLDMGVGKGYLACHLALDLRVPVIGVEASLAHCQGLARRMALVERQSTGGQNAQHKALLAVSIGRVTGRTDVGALRSRALSWDAFLEASNALQAHVGHAHGSNIQGGCGDEIAGEAQSNVQHKLQVMQSLNTRKYLAVGLHACGDLTQIILRLPGAVPAVVPCCYPHMTSANFPAGVLGSTIQAVFQRLNTGNDQNNGIPIPRHFFSYACVGFDEQLDKMAETAQDFYERAVIEKFRRLKGECDKICFKRTTPDLVGELQAMGFTAEEVAKHIPALDEHLWRLKLNIIIRQLFGQVFESFIIMDRVTQRPGLSVCHILGGTSGRGFCIFGQ